MAKLGLRSVSSLKDWDILSEAGNTINSHSMAR